MAEINQIKPHSYRLDLPDGNHTLYHFENGVCVRIDITQTFFDAQLVLINKEQARANNSHLLISLNATK